jgi:hypothetical protein
MHRALALHLDHAILVRLPTKVSQKERYRTKNSLMKKYPGFFGQIIIDFQMIMKEI